MGVLAGGLPGFLPDGQEDLHVHQFSGYFRLGFSSRPFDQPPGFVQ